MSAIASPGSLVVRAVDATLAALKADNERMRTALQGYAAGCENCRGSGVKHANARGEFTTIPCAKCKWAREALGDPAG